MQQQEFEKLTPDQQETIVQQLRQEQQALKMILDKGMVFTVPKLLTGWMFKGDKKRRTFLIKKPYLSTMDRLADVYLSMRLDSFNLNEDNKKNRHMLVKANSKLPCQAIAIHYLNRPWKIKLFGGLLAAYLRDRIDSSNLREIVDICELMGDYTNFISSIASMAGTERTSAPKAEAIEAQ